jgi:hypothetical protein
MTDSGELPLGGLLGLRGSNLGPPRLLAFAIRARVAADILRRFRPASFGFAEPPKNFIVARKIPRCFTAFFALFSSFASSRFSASMMSNLSSSGSIETPDGLL